MAPEPPQGAFELACQHSDATPQISSDHSTLEEADSTRNQNQSDALLHDGSSLLSQETLSNDSQRRILLNVPPRHAWDRVGKRALSILVFGSWLLFGCLGFLLFLWIGARRAANDSGPESLWQTIVFSGWITRSITISSAIIRTAMASQAAILTAMIAALFLESRGVDLIQLPALSITRAVNVSPFSLLGSGLLNLRGRLSIDAIYPILVVVLSLVMAVGQFISNLLLSDFTTTAIAGPNISTLHATTVLDASLSVSAYIIESALTIFPRFAEYHEPLQSQESPQNRVYADTGVTFRAMIPWADSSSRLSIRDYKGPATTWNARVVCFSPDLTNSSLEIVPKSQRLRGNFDVREWHGSSKSTQRLFFECVLMWDVEGGSICSVALPSNSSMKFLGNSFLMVTRSSFLPDLSFQTDTGSPFDIMDGNNSRNWSIRQHAERTTAFNSSGHQMLSFSVCDMDRSVRERSVFMAGTSATYEPALNVLNKPRPESGTSIDTLALRRQLGATPEKLNVEERGILAIDLPTEERSFRAFRGGGTRSGLGDLAKNETVILRPNNLQTLAIWQYREMTAHETYSAIFFDVLDTTKNPAIAFQALSTVLMQQAYFESSFRWNIESTVSYVMSRDESLPIGSGGLISVVVLFVIHHIILLTVLLLFLIRTESSLLGNAWQSIAQVMSEDTREILSRANTMKDGELRKYLVETDPGFNRQGVIRKRNDGRYQFAAVMDEDTG